MLKMFVNIRRLRLSELQMLLSKLSQQRKKKIISIDKANVMATSQLWREVTTKYLEDNFPEIEIEHMLVDAATMHLLSETS